MAIEFQKSKVSGREPEIWRGEAKMLPGGFKPVQIFPIGTVLRRGTLLEVNFEDSTAAVCKAATVITGGTTTKVRVAKGNYFVVGDVVMKVGKTDVSPTIQSIDTSDAGYDVLNLSAGISGITAGDIVVEATPYAAAVTGDNATPEVPAAPKYNPNAIVGADKEFNGKGLPTIDAAYDALVLYPSVPYAILPEWVQGICLKFNPNIMFIKQ